MNQKDTKGRRNTVEITGCPSRGPSNFNQPRAARCEGQTVLSSRLITNQIRIRAREG